MLLALGASNVAKSQSAPPPIGGPFTGPVVPGAPFSAKATAVLNSAQADGRTSTLRVASRYFRDSAGRVRIEQTIPGAGTTAAPAVYAVVHSDVASRLVHVLDPATRTFRRNGRSMFATGFGGFGLTVAITPVRYAQYQVHEWRLGELGLPGHERTSGVTTTWLGTKQLEGLKVVGRRIAATVTAPLEIGGTVDILDEVWESPELRIVIASHTNDPRTGVLDYRVGEIRRIEPTASLFDVPAEYRDRPKTEYEPYEFLYEPIVVSRHGGRPSGR